ncbi:TPA: cofactor-independent phosphoglycerate mutase [bacterium]|nr:cofactor-independent phosphoglycerate mutase [bacterium]
MKYIVLIGDGMADYPIPELDNKTPLEVADTPNMDLIAKKGISGMVKTIPDNLPPGSDVANLSAVGYDPNIYYTGRGPLEAGSMGIKLKLDDIAYRCNIVCVQDGIMIDYSSGHITSEEAKELIDFLNDKLSKEDIVFHPGVSYRHLLVHTNGSESLKCTPPHDITDKEYKEYLPSGDGENIILDLMAKSRLILEDHPINKKRIANNKRPGNMIWPWGQGRTPDMPTFAEKFELKGSVISAVDLIKGIGFYAGLDIIDVPGATGYLDTNYIGKAEYALKSLENRDFVWVHVEAPDEASHAGDIDSKIQAIKDFDSKVVGTILDGIEEIKEDYMLLVLPDHLTPISVKTHVHGFVPFTVCGTKIKADGIDKYSESSANSGSLSFDNGHELLPYLINLVRN